MHCKSLGCLVKVYQGSDSQKMSPMLLDYSAAAKQGGSLGARSRLMEGASRFSEAMFVCGQSNNAQINLSKTKKGVSTAGCRAKRRDLSTFGASRPEFQSVKADPNHNWRSHPRAHKYHMRLPSGYVISTIFLSRRVLIHMQLGSQGIFLQAARRPP